MKTTLRTVGELMELEAAAKADVTETIRALEGERLKDFIRLISFIKKVNVDGKSYDENVKCACRLWLRDLLDKDDMGERPKRPEQKNE